MGRRCLGLLAALALLVAPGVALASAPLTTSETHSAAHVTVDQHRVLAHVAARPSSGREQRSQHQSGSTVAILGRASAITPGAARLQLAASRVDAAGERPSSSRPRAPPAVV
jgi:hypothetical protein